MVGELVKVYTSPDANTIFDISDLNNGVYIIRDYNGQNEITLGKIMKYSFN